MKPKWGQDAYFLCQENGSTYLLFNTLLADHDDTTYLYDITEGVSLKMRKWNSHGFLNL